jgi:hypothetical protein
MVQAQVANLVSEGSCLLLVEGLDDSHAIHNAFCLAVGKNPTFKIEPCGNDDEVLAILSSVVVGSVATKSVLGAVIDADADTGVEARLLSIRHSLESAYDIPDAFPPEGLILKPKETRANRQRLPVIGVWLMPDNVNSGIFEDLLCAAMTPESEKYISGVVDQATKDGMTHFRDVERPKAIVKTHIAWHDPKTKNLGEAISAKHFDNLLPACQSFIDWLNRLFGEVTQT